MGARCFSTGMYGTTRPTPPRLLVHGAQQRQQRELDDERSRPFALGRGDGALVVLGLVDEHDAALHVDVAPLQRAELARPQVEVDREHVHPPPGCGNLDARHQGAQFAGVEPRL